MDPRKIVSDKLKRYTNEVTTITTRGDTNGNLAGKGFLFYSAGDEQMYNAYYTLDGVGDNPAGDTVNMLSIEIAYGDSGDTAPTIGYYTRTVLQARPEHGIEWVVTGDTSQVVITNIKDRTHSVGDTTSPTVDWVGDSTDFTFTRTTSDLGQLTCSMITDIFNASYRFQPKKDEAFFLRYFSIGLSDTACDDAKKFGALTELTNGITLSVKDKDGNKIGDFGCPIQSNIDLRQLGLSVMDKDAANNDDSIIVLFNVEDYYGNEIKIDGGYGEYLECNIGDTTTGLTHFEMTAHGHNAPTVNRFGFNTAFEHDPDGH